MKNYVHRSSNSAIRTSLHDAREETGQLRSSFSKVRSPLA